MRVLSVTSECVPLIKTGGLADVAGALPGALAEHGIQMRTLLPGYRPVMAALGKSGKVVGTYPELFGGPAKLRAAVLDGLDLLVLDAPHLFDRPGSPYLDAQGHDWQDNAERFAALSWVAAEIARNGAKGWLPQVVHCHDWQAGLAPYYISRQGNAAKTILTIHNMAFHGLAPVEKLSALKLDAGDFDRDGFEFWGQISTLKAGLVWADHLTTVSPTYANELITPEFGMGLEGVITARRSDLSGILNGIDETVWDPATDPLVRNYKTPRGKAAAKSLLQKELGLAPSEGPLCVVVSRLSDQKGLDLLLQALPALTDRGGQLALLGSGDPVLEAGYREIAEHPSVRVFIGYDEAMSHRFIAGGDAVLVPSRFEPCGLTQLYGLRYGTVPVVAYTGGLVDTVINASPAALDAGVATGLQFHPIATDPLAQALIRTCELYARPDVWRRMQRNGMASRVGWGPSAARYAALYQSLVE